MFKQIIMEECIRNILYIISLFFCGISTLIIVVIVLLFSAGTRKNTGPI